MQTQIKETTNFWLKILLAAVITAALLAASLNNYLLFHVLAELFSVVIIFSIFVLTWNTQRFLDNGYLHFVGFAFLFVAAIDLVHALAYQNMGVFPGNTANLATQLWLAARYTQASALIIAPLLIQKRVSALGVMLGYALLAALLLTLIFSGRFPDAFILDQGLTPFKIYSEYVIILVMAASAALLYINRRFFDRVVLNYLLAFLATSILSEFAFTTYANVFSLANATGHILKIFAVYFLYKAILETGFIRPYSILYRSLAQREEELRHTNVLLENRVSERTQALREEIKVRKSAESDLQLAKSELENRVLERTAELQRVNQDLERELDFRRKAEDALRSSEARIRRLIEANIIGVITFGNDGSVHEANHTFLEMIGYTSQDLVEGKIDWIEITPEEYRPVDEVHRRAALEQGEAAPYEKEYIRKDGSRIPVLLGYARLENSEEFIGFVLDLQERKQAEAALAEYAARLELSNRELEEFAFVASHDLQEPLRKIQTFGERMADQLSGRISAEEEDYLERMLNATRRMRAMITALLALSRVTSRGKDFVPVDLNLVIQEVLSDLEIAAEKTGARFDIGPLPVIAADPPQMRQLLQNLLSNSLKFTRPGIPPEIQIGSRVFSSPAGQQVELTVKDNGIGFDPAHADRIFQPFQRLHGRGQYEGSGIGLAICRKIVDRHGGNITADGKPGEGATIRVYLPVRAEELLRPQPVSTSVG